MTPLHPHWHATDNTAPLDIQQGEAPPVTVEKQKPIRVSRRPAAVIGIFLAVSIGLMLMNDSDRLPSQVAAPGPTVRITADGFDPVNITVKPGDTVTWKNESTIPHVISSDGLKMPESKPFQSPSIFPGSQGSVIIERDTSAGEYDYISQTDDIAGTIKVEVPAPAASPAPADVTPPSLPVGDQTTSVMPLPEATPPGPPPTADLLPKNTHTVGTETIGATVSGNEPPQHTDRAPATPKPTSTPVTGPAQWIVVGMSVVGLLVFSHRSLRSFE